MQMGAGKDSGDFRSEGCKTMRMNSSRRFTRIEDHEALRMDTASPYSAMEDCKMASSHLNCTNENCDTMRMVSSYLLGVAVGPICAEILAWPLQV